MGKGRIQVSIIEARNVEGDQEHAQHYYVKLKLGAAEARTDVSQGSSTPKFLKDVRMEVGDPQTDVLKVEILQVGPRGDLVIGTHERPVLSFLNATTHVEWFKLTDATQEVTAEVCMVVRYNQQQQENTQAQQKVSKQIEKVDLQSQKSSRREQKSTKKSNNSPKSLKPISMPLAIALGILVGALGYLQSKKPKYYEVQEGDTLCSIGICFNRNYRHLADLNSEMIEDPNLIYPGDRIKIV